MCIMEEQLWTFEEKNETFLKITIIWSVRTIYNWEQGIIQNQSVTLKLMLNTS